MTRDRLRGRRAGRICRVRRPTRDERRAAGFLSVFLLLLGLGPGGGAPLVYMLRTCDKVVGAMEEEDEKRRRED